MRDDVDAAADKGEVSGLLPPLQADVVLVDGVVVPDSGAKRCAREVLAARFQPYVDYLAGGVVNAADNGAAQQFLAEPVVMTGVLERQRCRRWE